MTTVTKSITFDAAHMLAGHEGLCQNLHGHTYKVEVTAQYQSKKNLLEVIPEGPSQGMVIDFKDLKIAMAQVFDPYDHAFIYNSTSEDIVEQSIYGMLKDHGKKVVVFPTRATAEIMSWNFYNELQKFFVGTPVEITSVKVWETPTSFAEHTEVH